MKIIRNPIWAIKEYLMRRPQSKGQVSFFSWYAGNEPERIWVLYRVWRKLGKRHRNLIYSFLAQDDKLIVAIDTRMPSTLRLELEYRLWYIWCIDYLGDSVEFENIY